jgi:hypothetical protein
MAHRHLAANGSLLLLKGHNIDQEIADVWNDWVFEERRQPSLSDETGVILEISQLRPV